LIKWTDEQQMAIDERNCDLLVAAAAGAGKTAVLVERIIRRIIRDDKPIDIDNMLIVTFTNAAASEMRERIALALDKAIEKNPNSHRLQRQLLLLPKAGITTIHSFCMDVLKNNYHKVGLTPDFRIADETESVLLKIEAVEELFENQYEKGEKNFYKLLDSYSSNKGDNKLKDMVLEVYNFAQSIPWPKEWLIKKVEDYNVTKDFDFVKTKWAKIIIELVNIELSGCLNSLEKAYKVALTGDGLEKCADQLAYDIEYAKTLFHKEGNNWDDLYKTFNNFKMERQKNPGKYGDKDNYEVLKVLRKDAREKIDYLKREFFISDERGIKEDFSILYPLISYLSYLVMEFQRLYSSMKKEKGLIDFNDLEHFSLDILTERNVLGEIKPSDVALSLRDKYEEIMIDEYQDSNMVQEVILNIISKREIDNPNMFMVGDVKQSIYRFRQAKPELFLDKYNRYSEVSGDKDRKILLYKNFRSRKEIIHGVNCIFRQLMTEYIGEIDYCEKEFLNLGALYPKYDGEKEEDYELELHLLDLLGEEKPTEDVELEDEEDVEDEAIEDEDDLEEIQAEARIIGKRILEIVGDSGEKALNVYDKDIKGYRKAEYKDIVILLRTVVSWAETIEEELESMGIPIFADTGTGYFKRTEVQVVLSLLQIIDNPMQDIPLISVLKSPIGGFTSKELLEIRSLDKKAGFYDTLMLAASNDDEIGQKASAFLKRLEIWREKALHLPVDQLIWYLYSDTGYLSYVGAMPGGHQRQANLQILFERAKQYEETSFRGLFNFINFMEKVKSGSGDMGNAKILGEKDNVVRIMSIHKSKGLEFPVVVLGGIGKAFNLQDTRKTMLLHHETGFGTDLVDVDKRITYATIPKIAIKHRIKIEALSEEMRILYVAMSRAKEKLIITGFDKNLYKTMDKWLEALDYNREKLPAYMVISGNKYLNWIGTALIRHRDMTRLRESLKSIGTVRTAMEKDQSSWRFRIWKKSELLMQSQKDEKDFDLRKALDELKDYKKDVVLTEEINKKLGWIYPYIRTTALPVKLSVTELKRMGEEREDYVKELYEKQYIRKPLFMEEEKTMSRAQRGSIMHYIMQHLDLDRVNSLEEIKAQVNDLVLHDFITEEQAKAVAPSKIVNFFKTDLGKRIIEGDKVYREMPFNIEISSEEVFKDKDYKGLEDKILLQGVIDCYFIEKDRIILVDYKTDYVDGNEKEIAEKRYRIQIEYYTKALETILDKKVDEKYIFFFHSNKAVPM